MRSMDKKNPNAGEEHQPSFDALDCELDAALAKYSSVEPRAGLEERILANLSAQQASRTAGRAWWQWSLASAFAVAMITIAGLIWRSERKTAPVISTHAPVAIPNPEKTNAIEAARVPVTDKTVRRASSLRTARHAARASNEVAANPKLDQFPSQYPLAEQERVLALYVAQFYDEAVIVAEARTEALMREQQEEMQEAEKRQ